MAKQTYVGKGKVYIGPYDLSAALLFVGNVSQLDFNIAENRFAVQDFTEPGGGDFDTVRRIESVQLALTKWEFTPENLARVTRGSSSVITASTVTDEPHVAYKGGLVATDFLPDPALTMTVEVGATVYVAGTDYRRVPAGIEILASGDIDDAAVILITYTKLASSRIEALTSSGTPYKMIFQGLNEANSGKPVIVRAHRVQLGVAQTIPFISSEFASYNVGGDVLKDDTITGVGLSKFFQIDQANPT